LSVQQAAETEKKMINKHGTCALKMIKAMIMDLNADY
jgi:hypothetical protein